MNCLLVQVMSVVFKLGDHIFSGPTQLLGDQTDSSEPLDVLQSLENALKGRLPLKGESIKVDSSTFCFKEYRKQAKTLLTGLVNSISTVVPEFSLKETVPKSPLRPSGVHWNRVKCLPEELSLREVEHPTAYFRHCPESGESFMDFLDPTDKILRLCVSADEGTEVCELPKDTYKLSFEDNNASQNRGHKGLCV